MALRAARAEEMQNPKQNADVAAELAREAAPAAQQEALKLVDRDDGCGVLQSVAKALSSCAGFWRAPVISSLTQIALLLCRV